MGKENPNVSKKIIKSDYFKSNNLYKHNVKKLSGESLLWVSEETLKDSYRFLESPIYRVTANTSNAGEWDIVKNPATGAIIAVSRNDVNNFVRIHTFDATKTKEPKISDSTTSRNYQKIAINFGFPNGPASLSFERHTGNNDGYNKKIKHHTSAIDKAGRWGYGFFGQNFRRPNGECKVIFTEKLKSYYENKEKSKGTTKGTYLGFAMLCKKEKCILGLYTGRYQVVETAAVYK